MGFSFTLEWSRKRKCPGRGTEEGEPGQSGLGEVKVAPEGALAEGHDGPNSRLVLNLGQRDTRQKKAPTPVCESWG